MFAHAHEGLLGSGRRSAAGGLWWTQAGGRRPCQPRSGPPDTSNIEINGDADDPVNKLAMQGIADFEQYWSEEFPEALRQGLGTGQGRVLRCLPSEGGQPPPCATMPARSRATPSTARRETIVAWDAEGLLPELQKKFGDFVIPVVLAHEYGHAVQARSNFTARTVTRELQADCFAGAWAKHAKDDGVFDVNAADLDKALAGILDIRDTPGTSNMDPNAHGSGFDRVSAFQDGFDNGLGEVQGLPRRRADGARTAVQRRAGRVARR